MSLASDDSRYVWHPFTPMQAYSDESAPVIVSAEGFELVDESGRRYLDGVSSLWCNVHGHRVPEIDRAIRGSMGLRLAALGPLAIIDYAGWDISSSTFTNLAPDMRGDTEVPETIRKMVEAGHLGAKSGQGIYSYPPETIDEQIRQRDADYLSLVKLLHSAEDTA